MLQIVSRPIRMAPCMVPVGGTYEGKLNQDKTIIQTDFSIWKYSRRCLMYSNWAKINIDQTSTFARGFHLLFYGIFEMWLTFSNWYQSPVILINYKTIIKLLFLFLSDIHVTNPTINRINYLLIGYILFGSAFF